MKTHALHKGTFALLVGCGLLLAVTAHAQQTGREQLTFQITKTYADPAAAGVQTVYKLVPQFNTIRDARNRAGVLGLQSAGLSSIRRVENGFEASDGKWDYTLDTERQLETLFDRDVMTGKVRGEIVVPDIQQCRDVALSFLGGKNLIMGAAHEGLRYEMTNEMLCGHVGVDDAGKTPGTPRVTMREIVFGKTIGGTAIVGPGSRVSVFVGDEGSVVGYMSNWMPSVATKSQIGVVSPARSFDLLKDRLAVSDRMLPDPQLRAKSVNVQGSRYALSALRNKSGELVLLPIYQFRGSLVDQRNKTVGFTYRVLAPSDRQAMLQDLQIAEPAAVKAPPPTKLRLIPGLQQRQRLTPPSRGGASLKVAPKQPSLTSPGAKLRLTPPTRGTQQ